MHEKHNDLGLCGVSVFFQTSTTNGGWDQKGERVPIEQRSSPEIVWNVVLK